MENPCYVDGGGPCFNDLNREEPAYATCQELGLEPNACNNVYVEVGDNPRAAYTGTCISDRFKHLTLILHQTFLAREPSSAPILLLGRIIQKSRLQYSIKSRV